MRIAVLQFPGSNCDQDCLYVGERLLNATSYIVWHKDTNLYNPDLVIIPGGFSYGDYLRCGAIARTAPIMRAVRQYSESGGLILGICNGFQILCEARLLPGALIKNHSLHFRCHPTHLRVENTDNPFFCLAKKDQVISLPIAHGEGCYVDIEKSLAETLSNKQIALRYCSASGQIEDSANPNGSLLSIAGILNSKKNILGLMPHPERACESILGSTDGLIIFNSIQYWCENNHANRSSNS